MRAGDVKKGEEGFVTTIIVTICVNGETGGEMLGVKHAQIHFQLGVCMAHHVSLVFKWLFDLGRHVLTTRVE